jgi:hypothetical protein
MRFLKIEHAIYAAIRVKKVWQKVASKQENTS